MFEYNKWDAGQWKEFWKADSEKAVEMLEDYERPLYIHSGNTKGQMNLTKFENSCFEVFIEEKIWKVKC